MTRKNDQFWSSLGKFEKSPQIVCPFQVYADSDILLHCYLYSQSQLGYEEALLKKMSMETFSSDYDPIISSNASSVGTLEILWQMSVANLNGEFSEAVTNKF